MAISYDQTIEHFYTAAMIESYNEFIQKLKDKAAKVRELYIHIGKVFDDSYPDIIYAAINGNGDIHLSKDTPYFDSIWYSDSEYLEFQGYIGDDNKPFIPSNYKTKIYTREEVYEFINKIIK